MRYMLLLLICFAAASCTKSDGDRGPLSKDKTKPGVVTNVRVNNFNGGANIIYDLPAHDDLLYVMAEYKINDKVTRQTKSSYYLDSLVVNGFEKSQEYEVKLWAVSRADIKSDPVVIKVHPDTPYYQLIKRSIIVTPDFGGVNVKAVNKDRRPVSLSVIAMNPDVNRFEIQDQHFTDVDSIAYSIRGFAAEPRQFGVFVGDEFGNVSDTAIVTVTPFFTMLLDKKKFSTYRLNSDAKTGYGWEVLYLWDDKVVEAQGPGWHTTGGSIPMQCTFNMGQTAKLSHFRLWERGGGSTYNYGEPEEFTIWGSNVENPADANMPSFAPEGTVLGDWVNLGNYHFPDPPSGLSPGATNAGDRQYVEAGVDFNIPLNAPPVKYIRFQVKSTWGGVDYCHMMELSFYGNPQ